MEEASLKGHDKTSLRDHERNLERKRFQNYCVIITVCRKRFSDSRFSCKQKNDEVQIPAQLQNLPGQMQAAIAATAVPHVIDPLVTTEQVQTAVPQDIDLLSWDQIREELLRVRDALGKGGFSGWHGLIPAVTIPAVTILGIWHTRLVWREETTADLGGGGLPRRLVVLFERRLEDDGFRYGIP